MSLWSRIRQTVRRTRPYEQLEAEGVADPERVARGAVRWADDYDELPRDWPYLKTLLDDGRLGAPFGLKYPRFVPLARMLAYEDGAVFERHLRWLLPEYWDGYPPERDGITPEMVFHAMDLLVDVPTARYETAGGVRVVLQDHDIYRAGRLDFHHPQGVASVDLSRVLGFEIRNDRVFVNDTPGPFEFSLEADDHAALAPLVTLMDRIRGANRTVERPATSAPADDTSVAVEPASAWMSESIPGDREPEA